MENSKQIPVVHVDSGGNKINPPHAVPAHMLAPTFVPPPSAPPVPPPTEHPLLKGRTGKQFASLRRIIKQNYGITLVSFEELTLLRDLEKRWKDLQAQVAEVTMESYDKRVSGLEKKYHDSPTAAALRELGEATKSREEAAKRSNVLQAAVYLEINRLSEKEIVPPCLIIIKRVANLLEQLTLQIQKGEQVLADDLEISWEPSEVLLCLYNRLRNLRDLQKPGWTSGGTPQSLVGEFIDL